MLGSRAVLLGACLTGVLSVQGCSLRNPIVRTIAPAVELTTRWQSIRISPPLELHRRTQRISIEVDDIAGWDVDNASGVFTTPEGELLRIEVQLVASDGRRFPLTALGLGPGLTFAHPVGPNGARLPSDATYPEVLLRSDVTWRGGPVAWIDLTNY